MDVKKIGRIPDGGGWRAHGRELGSTSAKRKALIGYDYVHSLVDDHSRLAYSRDPARREGPNLRGVPDPRRSLTSPATASPDRTLDDRQRLGLPPSLRAGLAELGVRQSFIRPHCPWQNGKVGAIQPHPAKRVGLPAGLRSPTKNVPTPLRPGLSTTTLDVATPHSEAFHRSADCHQPDGWVQLGGRPVRRGASAGFPPCGRLTATLTATAPDFRHTSAADF